MQDNRLYYEIDSWGQATQCLSNSSKRLHITHDVVMDKGFAADVIRVEHDYYGCLFAYCVNASGDLLCEDDGMLFELSPDQLLSELRKYGFLIQFSSRITLDSSQYKLLLTSSALGMDKLRIMYVTCDSVRSNKTPELAPYLVLFNVKGLSTWLSNVKTCSKAEFNDAVASGKAINITEADGGLHGHNWSFLKDKVLDVDDLVKHAER